MTTKYAFFKGKIVPIEDAKVSVMNHALNYGTGVFGGLRGYWNDEDEQLYVFRPRDHFERFVQSASLLRINVRYTPSELTDILAELLRYEDFHENCYIRPLAYKSMEGIGVRLHDVPDDVSIYTLPFGRYVENEEGAHVCISAWRRVDDNSIPARGKITGAYANSALIKTDAALAGYDEAIVLNNDGHVSEMSAANIFIIRKGVAYTPPVTSNTLEGITRRTIMHLLREDMGVEVVEREIDRTELYIADEIFMCGTGVQIAAITKIEHRVVGQGKLTGITHDLRDLYFDVVSGRIEKYRGWLHPVYAKEGVRAD